ncbi:MAG: hypothetical protein KC646_01145 [Candidatus Cloacimonetes bacterium]|nr:hypothetical protein [Candidatus Cloacimonadota bacterium]
MQQMFKGTLLGVAITVIFSFVINHTSHAEWFNSSAPYSDSGNLKAMRQSMDEINDKLERLIAVQKELVTATREQKDN